MRQGSTFKTGRFAVEGEPLEGPKHNPSSLSTTSHHHSIAHLPHSYILRHPVWIIERSVPFPSFVFLSLSRGWKRRRRVTRVNKQTKDGDRIRNARPRSLLSHAREVVITPLSSQLGSGSLCRLHSTDQTTTHDNRLDIALRSIIPQLSLSLLAITSSDDRTY